MRVTNQTFDIKINEEGSLEQLELRKDTHHMNWVISNKYLENVGYFSKDKLFGHFELVLENRKFSSINLAPTIRQVEKKIYVDYDFDLVHVLQTYDLSNENEIVWSIEIINKKNIVYKIQEFSVWIAFSDVMYRDKNVKRNVYHSAAVFPSISPDFSKIAVMRRTTKEKSIGMFQLKGESLSVGSYCDFSNKFLEATSPSLDGVLFYQLILSGENYRVKNNNDWIYSAKSVQLEPYSKITWQYALCEIEDMDDFYSTSEAYGHPRYNYLPNTIVDSNYVLSFNTYDVIEATDFYRKRNEVHSRKLPFDKNQIQTTFLVPGEHKLEFKLRDGRKDQIIIHVLTNQKEMIQKRVKYLCDYSYKENEGENPYAFYPISNQGESLGKLALILKKNRLDIFSADEVEKVEKSVNYYVLPKWFEDGDFKKPRKLYGDFYRVMDFEYLGHVLFLLAQFSNQQLTILTRETYLDMAAQIVELRINSKLHEEKREKIESRMLGVFFLYINDLIAQLEKTNPRKANKIKGIWRENLEKVIREKSFFSAAITEHFFDNAGFAPTAAAIATSEYGKQEENQVYSDLLLANIGFSNDFRMQNPDRWWEALSYMIHSLWGGITAAAAYDVFMENKDTRFLEASYRAFAAVLYCYDSNASSVEPIEQGAAVSTYSCVSPHLNRKDLGKKRFGQEIFAGDGGLFSKIFSEKSNQTSDWDMGEELVAYLDRFGKTAFCYFDDQELRTINCYSSFEENSYKIVSQAPYPEQIIFIYNNSLEVLNGNGKIGVIDSKKYKL